MIGLIFFVLIMISKSSIIVSFEDPVTPASEISFSSMDVNIIREILKQKTDVRNLIEEYYQVSKDTRDIESRKEFCKKYKIKI